MKETQTIDVHYCDVCKSRISIRPELCPLCGKELCLICCNGLYDYYQTGVCPECLGKEEIKAIITKYHNVWNATRPKVIKEMQKALS